MKTIRPGAVSLPLLLLLGLPASASVYRCTDGAGRVTYQAQPCPVDRNANPVELAGARPAPASAALRSAPAGVQRADDDDAWGTMTFDDGTVLPGPAAPAARRQPPLPSVPARPAWPEPSQIRLRFDLVDVAGRRQPWTPAGPAQGQVPGGALLDGASTGCAKGAAVVTGAKGREAYALSASGSALQWLPEGPGGRVQELTPPARLPALSWGCGLAWDTRGGVLTIASTGGEGHLYRFDTRSRRWLDARSLKDRDLLSLAFDAARGRVVGLSDRWELLVFSAEGAVERVRDLHARLPGMPGGVNPLDGSAQGSVLFAQGGALAITRIHAGRVTHIWTYDPVSDRAQLTYTH